MLCLFYSIMEIKVDKDSVITITSIKLSGKKNYLQWSTSVKVFLKAKRNERYLVIEPPLSDDKGFERERRCPNGCGIVWNTT